jgi:hypothetical protein
MTGFEKASEEKTFVDIQSFVERPVPMEIPKLRGIFDS